MCILFEKAAIKLDKIEGKFDMEEKKDDISFEEVLDNEVDDIWEIFFPYMAEKNEQLQNAETAVEKSKPRRYLKFLTM